MIVSLWSSDITWTIDWVINNCFCLHSFELCTNGWVIWLIKSKSCVFTVVDAVKTMHGLTEWVKSLCLYSCWCCKNGWVIWLSKSKACVYTVVDAVKTMNELTEWVKSLCLYCCGCCKNGCATKWVNMLFVNTVVNSVKFDVWIDWVSQKLVFIQLWML